MAIFYVSDIYFTSRAKGQSSISSAAYIEDRTLKDERLNKVFRYGSDKTRKHEMTICLGSRLPDGHPIETQKLWNLAEKSETRCNARTARHQWFALPLAPEIGEKEQRQIADDIRKFFETRYNVATTASIHLEHDGNPHLHLQWTVRSVNSAGEFLEKTRLLDDKKTGPLECKEICRAWEAICNTYLAPEHHIDHRSYKERGLNITPALHLGSTAARMQNKGERSDHALAWEERERLREAERQELEELRRIEALELQLEKAKQLERERKNRELEDLRAETSKLFDIMEAENNASDIARRNQNNNQQSKLQREINREPAERACPNGRMDRETQQGHLQRTRGNQPDFGQTHDQTRNQQDSGRDERSAEITQRKSFGLRKLEGAKLLGKLQIARDKIENMATQLIETADILALDNMATQIKREIQLKQERQRPKTIHELLNQINNREPEWTRQHQRQHSRELEQEQPQRPHNGPSLTM